MLCADDDVLRAAHFQQLRAHMHAQALAQRQELARRHALAQRQALARLHALARVRAMAREERRRHGVFCVVLSVLEFTSLLLLMQAAAVWWVCA